MVQAHSKQSQVRAKNASKGGHPNGTSHSSRADLLNSYSLLRIYSLLPESSRRKWGHYKKYSFTKNSSMSNSKGVREWGNKKKKKTKTFNTPKKRIYCLLWFTPKLQSSLWVSGEAQLLAKSGTSMRAQYQPEGHNLVLEMCEDFTAHNTVIQKSNLS